MNAKDLVYASFEKIVGITEADFADYKDTHLLKSGILDSLSTVSLLSDISAAAGKTVSVSQMEAADYENIDTFIAKIESIL